jgi:Concanavalin A-like lectin/glucanases superfamily
MVVPLKVPTATSARADLTVTGAVAWSAAAWGTVYGEYDASNAASITAAAGKVSSVAVTTGTFAAITQATGANQPSTGTVTSPSGRNALVFDGNDVLASGSFTAAGNGTLVLVVKSNNLDAANHQPLGYPGPNVYVNTDHWGFYMGAAVDSTSPTEDANWHVIAAVFAGASSVLWYDGVTIASGNIGGSLSSSNNFYLGAQNTGNVGLVGAIGTLIIYNGIVANIPGMSAALKTRWGTV